MLLAALAVCAVAESAIAQNTRQRTVSLKTAKLAPPVGKAQRIIIQGTLGGRGEVTLDQNQFSEPDPFGDSHPITEMFAQPVPVKFEQIKLADPTGKRRKVYHIVGKLSQEGLRYYLVSPSRKTDTYRLVVEHGGDKRRVVTLEQFTAEKPTSQRVKTILRVKYTIQTSKPPNLIIKATGQVPGGGWTNPVLTRRIYVQPPADGMWGYDLFATPPTEAGTTVLTEISAENHWKGFDPAAIKGVRVFGVGRGVKEVRFAEKK